MQQAELQPALCTGVAATTHSKASAKDCGLNASICPACLGFTLAAALVCHSLPQDGVSGEIIYPYIYVWISCLHPWKKIFSFPLNCEQVLSPSQLGSYVTASRREKRDLPETVRLLLARTWCIDKHTVKFVIKSNETNKTEQRSCKNCGHYTALALSYIRDLDLEETRLLPSYGIFQPFTPIHQDHQSNHLVLHFWSVIFRTVTANTGTHIITSLWSKLFKNKLLWAVVTSV